MPEKKKIINKSFVIPIVCIFIVISLFYLMILEIKPSSTEVLTLSEIEQVDLSKEYVLLTAQIADFYPGELYEPEDFLSSPDSIVLDKNLNSEAKFGTYRMELNIPAHESYGITGLTADYGQKVYVNGELLSAAGKVSDDENLFVPETNYYTVYFTPETDSTEIIIQVAYHNHKYGHLKNIYLAEQEVIVEKNRAEFLSNGITLGVLLAFAIFFFGMFLSYTKRINFLWFALTCFCGALRYAIYFSKDIMVLLPDMSWYVLHKVEYITHLGFYLFFILHVVSVLKLKPKTWAKCVFVGGIGGICLYYAIVPSTIYTKYIFIIGTLITIILLGSIIYILWRSYRDKLLGSKENLITGLSTILMVGSWLCEVFTYQSFTLYVQPYVIMLIIFFNAIALTIQFSNAERELIFSQIREQEIAENAARLEQMNNLKTDFFHKMAHEIKTPLAIMSGYAQLTANQISKDEVDAETMLNLKVISAEAKRLAELASSLMEMPQTPISEAVLCKISIDEYLHYVAVVCKGLLEKRDNTLTIKGSTNQYIMGNMEMLVQMMINLSVNSNRHMEKGQFVIETLEEKDSGNIVLLVSDTGCGIPRINAEMIFEKGFTTNGTKGLGLSICKEIVQLHNGDIVLLTDEREGTVFRITIPILKDKEK